jgi:outer membrane protein W
MRAFTVAAILLMCASAVIAADTRAMQLSVFTSNLSFGQSNGQSQWGGGGGIALSRAWSPNWSTELAVAAQRESGLFTINSLAPSGAASPLTQRRDFSVFPADLTMQYRFLNQSRWIPYLVAGARYVGAPRSAQVEVTPSLGNLAGTGSNLQERRSVEAGAGLSVRITPRVGLRVDAMRLLRSDGVNYDPLVRTSFGVSFRF